MRSEDKNDVEVVKTPIQRYHHGPLGKVLQRFLQERGGRQDFDLIALEQLWQRAAQHDPAIGLHLFPFFTRQDWHVLSCLGFFAADAAQSLASWERYQVLASSLDSIRGVHADGIAGVAMKVDASADLERYMVEHYMTMATTQVSAALGTQLLPVRVCLRHPRPRYWGAYRPLLGEYLEFSAEENQLWFSCEDLALPNPGSNEGMFEVVCCELDRRLVQHKRQGGMAGRVAEQVRAGMLEGVQVTLEDVAEQLHLTARTLRRRLQEQDLNFRQLLDQVRAELDQYLTLQGLSRALVAERLGYSDTAAYLHARKRWVLDV